MCARIVDQSREAQLRVTRECPSSSAFASINNDQPENALLVDIFGKKTVRDDEEFQRRKLNNYNRELHAGRRWLLLFDEIFSFNSLPILLRTYNRDLVVVFFFFLFLELNHRF